MQECFNATLMPTGLLANTNAMSPVWLALGIIAQALVAAALIAHGVASSGAGRSIVPRPAVAIGIVGALLACIYAVVRQEWVLAFGQVLFVLIGVRIMTAAKTADRSHEAPRHRLPEVKPDSAEIKLTDLDRRRETNR